MLRKTVCLLTALLSVVAVALPASAERAGPLELRLVKRFPFQGGLELAAAGDRVFASQWNGHYNREEQPERGGVRIFDVSGRLPRAVGSLDCPGFDNDVAALSESVIAIGYGENACASDPGASGVLFADVSDPKAPRVLGDAGVYFAHTISVYPGLPLVYASPGGWLPASNEGRVDIVDASDPRDPKVVGEFTFDGYGCHDISFRITKTSKLAFCTTSSPVQLILDVSDPTAPQIAGRIVNPFIQYGHTALASPDGKLLAITDEAFVGHECATATAPVGGVWLYDISNPAVPVPVGYRAPRGGRDQVGHLLDGIPSYCTAAMLDWMPDGRLLVSWYAGGVELLDVSDPAAPSVVAGYHPQGSMAYGVDYYEGRVYVNDIDRGLEVLELVPAR